ncbi:MAG: hypothetical protein JW966_04185 [Anaerolineae bacterium]|nr:hypothetical protein [Anaerolineae bacterium]
MGNIGTLLSAAAPIGIIIALWVIAQISRRFGEVTHRPPFYRGFYLSLVLVLFPLVIRLLAVGLDEDEYADLGGNTTDALLHDVPLAIAITLAGIIAWRYWGWLVYAHDDQVSINNQQSKQSSQHKES